MATSKFDGLETEGAASLALAVQMLEEAETRSDRLERQLKLVLTILGTHLSKIGQVCRIESDGCLTVEPIAG